MPVWIIGRKVKLATNGHEYMAEPFLVFEEEVDADSACDLVETISGERPMKTRSTLFRVGEAARPSSTPQQ